MSITDLQHFRSTAEGLAVRDLRIKSAAAGRLFVRNGSSPTYAAIAPDGESWLVAVAGDPQTAVLLRDAQPASDEAAAIAAAARLLGGAPAELTAD